MNTVDISGIRKEKLLVDWCTEAGKAKSDELEKALNYAIRNVADNLDTFTFKFPSSGGIDGEYQLTNNADTFLSSNWTSSFWTDMVWLAYELTGDEKYKKVEFMLIKVGCVLMSL